MKKVVGKLKKHFALSKGDFVARVGGDEFLVVCKNISKDVFAERFQEVVNIICRMPMEQCPDIKMGISVGCADIYELSVCSAQALIKLADWRMYLAKENGKCRVVAENNPRETRK